MLNSIKIPFNVVVVKIAMLLNISERVQQFEK